MNTTIPAPAAATRPAPRTPLLGVRPFIAKELREWLRSWRAVTVLVVMTPLMLLNTLGPKIGETAALAKGQPVPADLPLDPTVNVLERWPAWLLLLTIVAGFNLLVGERDRGTLAWSLSKPLSRSGLIVGKWIAAVVMITVFGIVLPMVASVLAAVLAYGMPNLGTVVLGTVLLVATPVFLVALMLALSVIVPGQAAVAGGAIFIAVFPLMMVDVLPGLAAWFPSTIIQWAAATTMGGSTSPVTPIAWAVGTVAVLAFAVARLRAADL
jgi:ABC-type transport system involved in multi-copper enzyme maturation permease subunit